VNLEVNRGAVISAAYALFQEAGYGMASLADIAQRAEVSLEALQGQYPTKGAVLDAVLRAYSPIAEMGTALIAAEGESAEDILRDVFHRLIHVAEKHLPFFELALLDSYANENSYLTTISTKLFSDARTFLDRLEATGQLRPVSAVVLGRMIVSLLFGYVASERAIPLVARSAMRLLPSKAWLDGVIDLMLYGVLEDDAR
jgi:AcrR family transcriptional regulator